MATGRSARALVGGLLGRGAAADAARVARLEQRLADLERTVAGLDAGLGQVHATLVAADPELTRQVVESVRADVSRLVVEVDAAVARIAGGDVAAQG